MSKLPDYLGPYRVGKFIRSGNTTQIYEASKDRDRFVLKILRPQYWGNRAETNLLKHEYEVGKGIKSESVIGVYEYHVVSKVAFIVLEQFTTLNMKQMMREEGLGFAQVHFKSVVEQCVRGLLALHKQGWVHCDVKPDNFLINEEAKVKLIDFTISQKITRGKISAIFRSRGAVQGTRSYISPEQIRNEALDARADIYSLGCMFYELLTGKPPYTGSSPNDLLNNHLKAPIPSAQVVNDNVSDQLQDFLFRMMAKEPENRPSTMGDVLKEFATIRAFKRAPKLDSEKSTDDDE